MAKFFEIYLVYSRIEMKQLVKTLHVMAMASMGMNKVDEPWRSTGVFVSPFALSDILSRFCSTIVELVK